MDLWDHGSLTRAERHPIRASHFGPIALKNPMRLTSVQNSLRRMLGGSTEPAPRPPLPASRAPSTRQPWLLLYNCQGMGLANSLNLLCPGIDVEFHDPSGFTRQREAITVRLPSFERILIAPQLEKTLELDLAGLDNVWRVPTINFDGYHPDICYLLHAGKSLKGPLGDYHSLIAYAAFRSGVDEAGAIRLFDERMYEALGYFERWDPARTRLLELFRSHGLDISSLYVHWSRNGPFMYSFNHVRIHCLRDVALAILERAGLEVQNVDFLPHDNLANGPVYPIYPEIASRVGTHGNYLFKPGGKYQCIGLEEFVTASFDLYRSADAAEIRPEYARALAHALKTIGELH